MLIENRRGHCWHCGEALQGFDYNREVHCSGCGKANHSCKNCRFFKPDIAHQCSEPVADHVGEKDRANFCAYFEPGSAIGTASDDENPLQAAESLFD